jgi:hypothetical protein
MGATKEIPRSEWQRYFDDLAKRHLRGDTAAVASLELMSAELGDQLEETAAPLIGLSYDPKSEALEVILADRDHLVFHPAEIWVVEEDDGFVSALEVVYGDGTHEVMELQRTAEPEPVYPAS